MLLGKRVVVVMPAYNAAKTLRKTYEGIPPGIVDLAILTDDGSGDDTAEVAEGLGLLTVRHERNRGYGANQKTCYREAMAEDADIVIMLHPDYQYDPRLIPAMAGLVASGVYDVVIGSRLLTESPRKGGMPLYKYFSNRLLTLFLNWMTGYRLSEYHTGYRAFSRAALEGLPLLENSDDFVFDNQMLLQTLFFGYRLGEMSSPAHYDDESSSIDFKRSVRYGLGCVWNGILYRLAKWKLVELRRYSYAGRKLLPVREGT